MAEGTLGWWSSLWGFPIMNVALGISFCCPEAHSEGQPEVWVLAVE